VRKATSAFQLGAYWLVDPLDGTTNFCGGIPYWAISLARFEGGVRGAWRSWMCAALRNGSWRCGARGAWLQRQNGCSPPSTDGPASIGCALRSGSLFIGVPAEAAGSPLSPARFACWVWPASSGQAWPWGRRWQLWRPPEIWDLAAAWLVLSELGCPLRWLQNTVRKALSPGATSRSDFSCAGGQGSSHPGCVHAWGERC